MDIKELTQENADALRKVIGEKLTCPMCGNKDFIVLGGFVRSDLQTRLDSFVMFSSDVLNIAPVICQRCGFVSFHDMKVLARIKKNGGENGNK